MTNYKTAIRESSKELSTREKIKLKDLTSAIAIDKVVEPEKLEKTVAQVCKRLLRGSINSYRAIKEMVWKSQFENWEDYAQLELDLQRELAFKEDFKEGVIAHSERRRPNFKGK